MFPLLASFVHDRFKLFSRGGLILLLVVAAKASVTDQTVLSAEEILSPASLGYDNDEAFGNSFSLRHVLHHGTEKYPNLLRRLDIEKDRIAWSAGGEEAVSACPLLTLKKQPIDIRRLRDRSVATVENRLSTARSRGGLYSDNSMLAWTVDRVMAPNITDKETVTNLAKMAANAYIHIPATDDWRDIGVPWNSSAGFGWENDGLRGHIFLDEKNTTVIISIKGTSVAIFYGEETKTNDKVNDNLFFSCCCARVSAFWSTVCDCYTDTYSCSNPCLSDALKQENRYYRAALNLYYNVTQLYPNADVWLVGHSLGGAVSSLLGQTYGLPAVTFEAPPERLAASRLGIPTPPTGERDGMTGAYHFGNNADPIYMGVCNGVTSFCSIGGYAMETKCHTGKLCLYDVVNDLGWRVNGNSHRIRTVIDEVMPKYETVPECVPEDEECTDCYNWNFHNETITTTTTPTKTSTTTTSTRTTTCQHPGWWGCLDETTTVTTTSSTTSTTSKTCSKYGWFGDCLDSTTSISTPTTLISSGDVSQKPIMTSTSFRHISSSTSPHSTTTSCATPGFFWGCRDKTTSTTY